MGREIKFRAWDKRKKQFISWEEIKRNTSMNLFGGYWELFNRNEFVPMQYIGLGAENADETDETDVYEGDIVETFEDKKIWEIYYEGACFRMMTHSKKHRNNKIITEFMGTLHDAKIIGNIYENPELIRS